MNTAVTQPIDIQHIRYSHLPKPKAEKKLQNGKAIFPKKEKTEPIYETRPINRERLLASIEFLTQYMEDLKAGRPVENICEDDPFYLVPENIAYMIEQDKALLKAGEMKVIRANSLKDLIGEWDI